MLLVHRMLRSDTHPAEAAERCPLILETWLRHAPESRPEVRDFEDWAENAHILHALAAHGDVTLLSQESSVRFLDITPAMPARPDMPQGIMWGMYRASDVVRPPLDFHPLWNNADETRKVQSHFRSPTFLAHAGRRVEVCDYTRTSISEGLTRLHDDSVRLGFAKTRNKGATSLFEMGEDRSRLFSDMDPDQDWSWSMLNREGEVDAVIVQERFEPTCEYRVVVVGAEPVTGAGCIEAFTPCESEGSHFDDRMEVVRNDGSVIRDSGLAARYLDFATRYADAWAAENGSTGAYSLDLCIDARTGSIAVIEMNPMLNLGLYANDPDRIVRAMIAGRP